MVLRTWIVPEPNPNLSLTINKIDYRKFDYEDLRWIYSSAMKKYYEEFCKLISLKSNDLVIDIGSNDGNLLNNFKKNHKVLGVTPENIGKIAIKKGIRTLIKYFDTKTSKYIFKKFGKAKIVTATNVFAHIENVVNLYILQLRYQSSVQL